ncbi:MAG: hypothetical protein AB7I41_22120 [Candidatus Sericytochromatia bacterium]
MSDILAPFSFWLVLTLNALPGISSLHWSPEGLWILADNVDGLYQLDLHSHELSPRLALRSRGDFAQIPKAHKSDFEASAWMNNQLWIFGSGSLGEIRNRLVKVELLAQSFEVSSLSPLYAQIQSRGLELNIEGATAFGGGLLLANRGHLGQPDNHLIRVQDEQVVGLQRLDLPTEVFAGISALEYEAATDRLWFTATTELTGSVYEDGSIGDSYVGWIENFSQIDFQTEIKPSQLFNLSQIDSRFVGQKIEGLALSPEKLYLGSDNDGAPPHLFVLERSPHCQNGKIQHHLPNRG